MKKITRILVSQRFIVTLTAILQIGLVYGLFSTLTTRAPVIYTALVLLSVLAVVFLFDNDTMNPSYKIIWLLLMVVFPVTGGLFYVFFGNRRLPRKSAEAIHRVEEAANNALVPQPEAFLGLSETFDNDYDAHAIYLQNATKSPVCGNTECTYFSEGEHFWEAFCDELKKAEKFIFLEFFIIDEGYVWDTVLEILRNKVAEGVNVKLLYDDLGCIFTLEENFPEQMRSLGIECYAFNPVRLSTNISSYLMLNHRDHRKICIIDGNVGFNGGVNLADEYINKKVRFGHWKDTAYMIKGPAVFNLTATFSKCWQIASREVFDYETCRPTVSYPFDGFVQPFDDTPLDDQPVSQFAYLNVINRAEKYVYITTPYLIIDSDTFTALSLAAKSGIDIRIVTPAIPDKWYAFWVTQSYYKGLLNAGVRIFEYTPGFMHAKMYLSDDDLAIVGSANMDYRSLFLHFESCATFYGGQFVKDVKKDFMGIFEVSKEITIEEVNKTPLPKRLIQLVFRLFAPMM